MPDYRATRFINTREADTCHFKAASDEAARELLLAGQYSRVERRRRSDRLRSSRRGSFARPLHRQRRLRNRRRRNPASRHDALRPALPGLRDERRSPWRRRRLRRRHRYAGGAHRTRPARFAATSPASNAARQDTVIRPQPTPALTRAFFFFGANHDPRPRQPGRSDPCRTPDPARQNPRPAHRRFRQHEGRNLAPLHLRLGRCDPGHEHASRQPEILSRSATAASTIPAGSIRPFPKHA